MLLVETKDDMTHEAFPNEFGAQDGAYRNSPHPFAISFLIV